MQFRVKKDDLMPKVSLASSSLIDGLDDAQKLLVLHRIENKLLLGAYSPLLTYYSEIENVEFLDDEKVTAVIKSSDFKDLEFQTAKDITISCLDFTVSDRSVDIIITEEGKIISTNPATDYLDDFTNTTAIQWINSKRPVINKLFFDLLDISNDDMQSIESNTLLSILEIFSKTVEKNPGESGYIFFGNERIFSLGRVINYTDTNPLSAQFAIQEKALPFFIKALKSTPNEIIHYVVRSKSLIIKLNSSLFVYKVDLTEEKGNVTKLVETEAMYKMILPLDYTVSLLSRLRGKTNINVTRELMKFKGNVETSVNVLNSNVEGSIDMSVAAESLLSTVIVKVGSQLRFDFLKVDDKTLLRVYDESKKWFSVMTLEWKGL